YVLEHTAVEHRIQRIDAGGPVIVASNLSDARGLETANDEVLTTHGPLDGADPLCHLSAFTASERRDVMADECPDGANAFHAIAVEGATAAASFVVSQANDHSDVRRANLDGTDGTGILIGLGEDDGAGVPSVAIDGGTFFWVDSQFDDVMTSEGAELPGINNPPGATVNVLSSGLAGAGEVVLADGKPYLTLGSEVASLSTNGEVTSLGAAQSPRGLAADGALVVWAEPARVRAHVLASGQTVTVDDAGDEPVDVALASDFVVYVTRGGRVVRVPRL
ncbi:MAG: hypothetical protein JNK04_26565, partial [Myxococcales bacterium]|nr:hypothetical protein [Myxococcales bacterium]